MTLMVLDLLHAALVQLYETVIFERRSRQAYEALICLASAVRFPRGSQIRAPLVFGLEC